MNPSSTSIAHLKYNEEELELEVTFVNDKKYIYENVAPSVWQDFRDTINNGGSAGKYFHKWIKNLYTYRKD